MHTNGRYPLLGSLGPIATKIPKSLIGSLIMACYMSRKTINAKQLHNILVHSILLIMLHAVYPLTIQRGNKNTKELAISMVHSILLSI
jgi:hypothetical protein